jgi:hypothetical protein
LVFSVSGIAVGTALGVFIGKDSLCDFWFYKTDIFLVPRCVYWAAHGVGLMSVVMLGCLIDPAFRFTGRSATERVLRAVGSALLIAISIPLVACVVMWAGSQPPDEGFGFDCLLLGAPIMVALLISLAMFVLTRAWHNLIAALLALAAYLAILFGSLVATATLLSNRQIGRSAFYLALLGMLCGWWIHRAMPSLPSQ